ncbi:MAG TPA: tetratricopeptide repeat protein, partial [Pirellulales bacterium]|nr:tetratricopeptide repeat protein [Pirellulales bacterium]
GVLILLWRRQPAGYVGAWVLLILSPTFFVPIVTEVMAERRMYLPLAALLTLAVAGGYWAVQWTWTKVSAARAVPRTKERWRVVDGRILAVVGSAALTLALACCLLDIHRLAAYQDALALWQDTAATQPDDSVAFNNWGLELVNVDRVPEAIECYRRALQLDGQHVEVRANLGTALMKMGRIQDAIDQYQQALQFKPDFIEARCNLGIALGKIGKNQAAIEQLQIAQRIDSDNATVHFNLGIGLGQADRLPEAIEQFQEALRLDPDYKGARIKLGMALLNAQRPQQAVQEFQRVLQTTPTDCGIYFNLALAYAQLNRSQDALKAAKQAAELAGIQNQTETAQEIEAWLNDYKAGMANPPDLTSRGDAASQNR